jgi:carboxyl-terminal processing protease
VIQVNSVESRRVDLDGRSLLHLTVESFSSRTAIEVRQAIEQHEDGKSRRLDGLIIDLRNNPGGLLDQAVEMSDLFLATGKIVTTKGRRQEIERATRDFHEFTAPMVVLINGDSASASEIVAGALQDQNRAVVIGQPSFGKGSVQTIFELPGEQAIKLTIARYYTPSGRSIQNVGITPHIWLQPLYRNDKNSNLLGTFRYKSENFLLGRLEGNISGLAEAREVSEHKFYYLTDTAPDDLTETKDVELDFARAFLARVAQSRGKGPSPNNRPASAWLATAKPEIKTRGLGFQQATEAWLRHKYAIDWSGPGAPDAKALTIEFGQGLANPLIVDDLPDMTIPWRVTNPGSTDLLRVSVFVTSPSAGIEAAEFVVGRVPAGGVREGVIRTAIIPELVAPAAQLRLGMAVDSLPVSMSESKLTVRIKRTQKPRLVPAIILANESGATDDGLLEANEQADLKVTLTNEGTTDATRVRLLLKNLAGRQVVVDDKAIEVGTIKAGHSKVARLKIRASETLISEHVNLGLSLTCEGLSSPKFHNFMIVSKPNMTRDRFSTLFGH